MPQLRKDPVTSRWVIVNAEDPLKASAFPATKHVRSSRLCPFCPGNEGMTPPTIQVYGRKPGSADPANWLVRVISNKFPALRIEETTTFSNVGIYDRVGGFGAHEIIVENPDHEKEISQLPQSHVALILQAFKDRCLDLRKDSRFKYILIFKNYGLSAGASQEHPHSQLIALPIVPSRVVSELDGARQHFEYTDRCIFCDMLAQDKTERKFLIGEEGGFVAMAPFASRFPFETWILPKKHTGGFDAIEDEDIDSLAKILKETLYKLKVALHDPAYNLMIHTTPIDGKSYDSYHWHIEVIPHLTRVAGFELGSGFYVNPSSPELTASTLSNIQGTNL